MPLPASVGKSPGLRSTSYPARLILPPPPPTGYKSTRMFSICKKKPPTETERYAAAWLENRRMQRFGITGILAWCLIGTLAAIPSHGNLAFFAEVSLAFLSLFCILIWLAWQSSFACPRCGKNYYCTGLSIAPLTRHCCHCHLKKNALPEIVPDTGETGTPHPDA